MSDVKKWPLLKLSSSSGLEKTWPEALTKCVCVCVCVCVSKEEHVLSLQTHLRDNHIRDTSKCILGDTNYSRPKVYLILSIVS